MEWQIGAFQRSTAGCRWLGHLAIEPRAAPAVDRDADPIDPVEAGPPVHASTVVPDPGPAPLRFHGKHLVEVQWPATRTRTMSSVSTLSAWTGAITTAAPDGMSGRIEVPTGRHVTVSPAASRAARAPRFMNAMVAQARPSEHRRFVRAGLEGARAGK